MTDFNVGICSGRSRRATDGVKITEVASISAMLSASLLCRSLSRGTHKQQPSARVTKTLQMDMSNPYGEKSYNRDDAVNPNLSAWWAKADDIFPCVITVPFGVPVLPEVNTTYIVDEGLLAGRSNVGSGESDEADSESGSSMVTTRRFNFMLNA
ncbi:hypothetical protein E4U25_000470 [Claviceps purpurea]|nr:hypothetical protein E4U36_000535 [Claviceps purpurea]KAG6239671.1 hypothetical protein E4U25_000470 [Claviceps purpurea]